MIPPEKPLAKRATQPQNLENLEQNRSKRAESTLVLMMYTTMGLYFLMSLRRRVEVSPE